MFKKQLITLFSIIFALYIVFHHHLTKIIIKINSKIPFLTNIDHHFKNIWYNSSNNKTRIHQYFSTISNASISLMLSFSIINYHEHFLNLIVFCLHNVHHLFINKILQVSDYSQYLKQSIHFKIIICYIYLIFGYIGISSQVILTVDLIYIFNLPTIIIYKLLAKVYKFLIKSITIIKDILTIKQKYWLTCPYPRILLADSFKIIYLALLPVVFYMIIIIIFYYLWLAFIIAILKIFINIGYNVGLALNELGSLIMILKGISPQHKLIKYKMNFTDKCYQGINKLNNLQWITIVNYQMFLQIFKGIDLFYFPKDTEYNLNIINIYQIYKQLSSLV